MAPPEKKVPPEWFIPVSFHFSVSIGKQPVSFSEVKGIDFTLETESVISGGDSFTKYYLPKGKKFSDLVRNGDYSRIASYSENNEYDCWASIAKDKSKALVTFVQVLNHPNYKTRFITY